MRRRRWASQSWEKKVGQKTTNQKTKKTRRNNKNRRNKSRNKSAPKESSPLSRGATPLFRWCCFFAWDLGLGILKTKEDTHTHTRMVLIMGFTGCNPQGLSIVPPKNTQRSPIFDGSGTFSLVPLQKIHAPKGERGVRESPKRA